jgi:putative transposase
MARKRRVYVEGAAVHVVQRGNNRGRIFGDDGDRATFLDFLRTSSADRGTQVHHYVLMDNHYHLVVTPEHKSALARTIKHFGGRYVQYYNKRYARTGTLWDGRYDDFVIADERYFFTCVRYVEHNPVKAGMVTEPDAYQWSSYRSHAFGEPPSWLTPHALFLALGKTQKERQAAYRALSKLLPDVDPGSDPLGRGSVPAALRAATPTADLQLIGV